MDDQPFARATIGPRGITLNPWRPGLIDGGPGAMLLRGLRRRGIVFADLVGNREDRELIVRFVPRDSATDAARDAIAQWAATVGWERVWLDDRVIDLDDSQSPAGRARAVCPTCGLRWEDERPEFWDHVRRDGWFPGSCLGCGGSLPEWDLAQDPQPVRQRRASVDAPISAKLNRPVR